MEKAERGALIVLPEYSNAGGISDPESDTRGGMVRNDEFINMGLRPEVFIK